MARADAKYSVTLEDKTQQALRRIQGNLGRVDGAIVGMSRGLGGLAGIVGVGAIVALGKQSIDAADRIGKLSDRLGASTEALSEYQHVAELSGVSNETLTLGWQRMTRRIAEAAQGTGEARGALDELNLSARDLNGLAPDQQFEAIADAMQGVTNQSDRVRLAMKLFDSEGVALVQTMGNGAQGIREVRAEARALGKSLSSEQTAAAARFNDEVTRLNASFGALGQTMVLNLAGPMADTTEWLNETIKTMSAGSFRVRSFFADMFGLDAVAAETPQQLAVLRGQMIEVQDDIQERTADIIATNQRLVELPPTSVAAGFLRDEIDRLNTELGVLREEEQRLRQQIAPSDAFVMGQGSVTKAPVIAESVDPYREAALQIIDIERAATASINFETERRLEAHKLAAEQRVKIEQEVVQSKMMLEQTAAANFQQVQAYLAGKSKDWARLILVANKAAALANVIVSTNVAAMKAREIDPTGVLSAEVYRAGALAKIAIAGATLSGLAQINESSRGGGPAAPGGTLNPINTNPLGQAQPQTQQVTNVYISGYIDTAEGRRVLGDIFRDLDRDDVVFLSANGANAQVIRSGV